jgi:DNA-binding GntR family transcriptional regulator
MYVQIAQTLSEQIHQGIYPAGSKLPSEKELCGLFYVSRITVRQALSLLVQQDLVVPVHGKGSIVKAPTLSHNLSKIISFQHLLQQRGLTGYTLVEDFHTNSENEKAKAYLGNKVSMLSLIGYISDQPAVYYESYFRPELGEKMQEAAQDAAKSEYAFSTYDLYPIVKETPVRITQTVRAINASAELEKRMDLPPKRALMVLESVYYAADDTVLEYKVGYYRSEVYSFQLIRQV